MKKRKLIIGAILAMFVIMACEKTEDSNSISVVGSYEGTLSFETNLKNIKNASYATVDAIADIKPVSEGLIEMHCYGEGIDTTLMLSYFYHEDSVMVCLTGSDFEHMYGHMLGSGHMAGGMMNDMQNGETEWQHHMSDEHLESDEHFGGFDIMQHTFSYTFKMNDGVFYFHGTKK
jgi:hypothetical protein